jgi:hypothetical protein
MVINSTLSDLSIHKNSQRQNIVVQNPSKHNLICGDDIKQPSQNLIL